MQNLHSASAGEIRDVQTTPESASRSGRAANNDLLPSSVVSAISAVKLFLLWEWEEINRG